MFLNLNDVVMEFVVFLDDSLIFSLQWHESLLIEGVLVLDHLDLVL